MGYAPRLTILLLFLTGLCRDGLAEDVVFQGETVPVGVAKVDVTPTHPVLLAGYGGRPGEHEGVDTRIWARALAVGEEPTLLVAVDNCGVPAPVVEDIAARLRKLHAIPRERLVICSTHTHNAPTLTGYAIVVWGGRATPEQLERVDRYTRFLQDKIVEAVSAALRDRKPARLVWSQGRVTFGGNRRVIQSGGWGGFGFEKTGPVDHSLPVLAAQDEGGRLRAVWTTYACHCTTIGGRNHIAGDWAGFANDAIEERFPEAIALTTIGCGADIGPRPSGGAEIARTHGQSIADEVWSLYRSGRLLDLPPRIEARHRQVKLPFDAIPPRDHWERQTGAFHEFHAKEQLRRLDRDGHLPTHLPYPITTWTFGDTLGIVFLAGEVVVDYSVRLKRELDWRRLWLNGWANDVPCYIPSKRLLSEGGYEVDFSQIYYNQPTRFAPETEDVIVEAVHALLGDDFSPPPAQAGAPYHHHPSAQPAPASNRLSFLNSQDICYFGSAVPEGAGTSWRVEGKLGEVIVMTLDRMRADADFIRSLVARINRGELEDHVLQLRGRHPGPWRILDLNADGFLDVLDLRADGSRMFLWSEESGDWVEGDFPLRSGTTVDAGLLWGVLRGLPTVLVRTAAQARAWQFDGARWKAAPEFLNGLEADGYRLFSGLGGRDVGARLWDLDRDGDCELLFGNRTRSHALRWNEPRKRWQQLPFGLPKGAAWVDEGGRDCGLRIQDIDSDGKDDLILATDESYAVHVFHSMATGWSEPIIAGARSDETATTVPAIVTAFGRATGAWYDAANRRIVRPAGDAEGEVAGADLGAQVAFQRQARRRVQALLAKNPAHREKLAGFQDQLVSGFQRVLLNQGSEDTWFTFTGGQRPRPYIRQQQEGVTLSWHTPTPDLEALESRRQITIVFAGGLGWISEPATDGFELLVDDQPLLSFDVTLEAKSWKGGPKGRSELFYFPTWTSNVDSAGFFYLTLRRNHFTPGAPLQLGVRSRGAGSKRWFAVDTFRNAKGLQHLMLTSGS